MTPAGILHAHRNGILIHTSVKLVTCFAFAMPQARPYFNPHEREARDLMRFSSPSGSYNFNPHEREARDMQWWADYLDAARF